MLELQWTWLRDRHLTIDNTKGYEIALSNMSLRLNLQNMSPWPRSNTFSKVSDIHVLIHIRSLELMLELKLNRVDFPGYVVHICAVYPTLQPAWHYIWWFGCHPGYAGTVFSTLLSWHQITLNYDHPVYHVFLLRSFKILYLHRGSSYHGLFWKILFWGACMNIISQVARDWQARLNKLPPAGIKLLGSVSAWTATLLFMWAPVAQAVCVLIMLSFRYATCYVYKEGSELHIGLPYLQDGLWNLQIGDLWIMWCWGTVVELLKSCQHKGSISVHCVAGYGRERFAAATRSIYSRSYVVCFSTSYWECGQSFLLWLNSGLIWLVSSGDFESLTWIRNKETCLKCTTRV